MPQIEVIDRLKSLINSLGGEPEFNEENGLTIDDIQPPDPIIDSELNELLNDEAVSSTGEDAPEDMNSLLASFQEELESEGSEDSGEEDTELTDLLDDMDSELASMEAEEEEPQSAETEEIPESDDFSIDDLEDMESLDEAEEYADSGDEKIEEPADTFDPAANILANEEETFSSGEFDDLDLGDIEDVSDDFSDEDLHKEDTDSDTAEEPSIDDFELVDFSDAETFDDSAPGDIDEISSLDEEDFDLPDDIGDLAEEPDEISGETEENFSDEDIDGLADAFGEIDDIENPDEDTPLEDETADFSEPSDDEDLDDLEDLPDLEDMDGIEEIPEMDDFGDLSLEEPESLDDGDIPDIGAKLDSLAEAAESTDEEEFDMSSEINLDEELSDDFLDDISEEDDGGAQHFSLDDLGAGFNLDEDDAGSMLGMDIDQIEQEIDAEEDAVFDEDIVISPSDLQAIQRTLNSFPRNLKIEIETLLGDETFEGPKLRNLLNLLINGQSPRQVSNQIFRMTGKKVILPKGYEKQTGTEFLDKKKGFTYIFTQEGWPLLRKILIGIAAVWVVVILSFTLLYRPITAHSYYKKGYELIQSDQYDMANENFSNGYFGWQAGPMQIKGWRTKKWFYRYAEAYRDRHAYTEASQKYEQLLQVYPDDWQGRYDYAEMLTYEMEAYDRAERQLLVLIDKDVTDYEAMLALGDNYFHWSDRDPSQLENARKTYAGIIDYYGNVDDVQLRMIRYFLKTNDSVNLQRLTNMYREKKKITCDPTLMAEVFGELAGYHLSSGQEGDAAFLLDKAMEADPAVPEVHYQYARYYRQLFSPELEEKALNSTLFSLTSRIPLSRRDTEIEIDTYKRLGDLYSSRSDYDRAEQEYLNAITLYQQALDRNQIRPSRKDGELYATAGNIYYFIRGKRDFDAALDFYLKAENLGYDTPELQYRKGYIYYSEKEDLDSALSYFYEASRAYPNQINAQYALANTLMLKKDYYSAQGTYEEILKLIRDKEETITFLVPNEKAEHREIIELYKRVHNNLGVALYQISRKSPGNDWYSEALYEFTKSSDYSDILTRDPESLTRSREMSDTGLPGAQPIYTSFDLAYDNRMLLLYPLPGQSPAMYTNLQMDILTFYQLDNYNQ